MRPLPDFVIIGAQKSGSTALMRHLAAHPQVHLPEQETRYFRDPWFHFESPDVLHEAAETSKPGVRRRGIKCPDCLAEPTSTQRIIDALGRVQLMAVLREPVDRAISAYYWGMQWGWVPLAPPEVGFPRLLAGDLDADYPRAHEVLEYGLYAKHLSRYFDIYGRDNVLVLLDDDLRARRDATLKTVFEYLGVDSDAPVEVPERSVNAGVYSTTRLKVLQHRHKHILREFPGYPGKYLQPAVGVWPRTVNRAISVYDRVLLARVCNNARPPVAPAVRAALGEFYRQDVEQLAGLIDRDLSAWLTARPASDHAAG